MHRAAMPQAGRQVRKLLPRNWPESFRKISGALDALGAGAVKVRRYKRDGAGGAGEMGQVRRGSWDKGGRKALVRGGRWAATMMRSMDFFHFFWVGDAENDERWTLFFF